MLFIPLVPLCVLAALAAAGVVPPVGTGQPNSTKTPTGRARPHRNRPVKLLDKALVSAGNVSANELTSYWAGAAYHDFESGTFRHVSATIVVPSACAPPGGDTGTTYYTSVWVSIDAYGGCSGSFMTGIDITVAGDRLYHDAWYEWYPDGAYGFSRELEIHSGDKLRLTVDAASGPHTGTATVENLSTGQSVSQAHTSSTALCASDAEWVVSGPWRDNGMAPFADFGAVTFGDAYVSVGPAGGVLGPGYAALMDLYQGRVLTSTSQGQWYIGVNYVG